MNNQQANEKQPQGCPVCGWRTMDSVRDEERQRRDEEWQRIKEIIARRHS